MTSPTDEPSRIYKKDRVRLAAIDIATALPGHWTVGRGSNFSEVADVVCVATGIRLGFIAVTEPGPWRYTLIPGPTPDDLQDAFMFSRSDGYPTASFTVGTPVSEVVTHIQQRLIPAFHQWIDDTLAAQHERDKAHYRVREARRQIIEQLEGELRPACGSVAIDYAGDDRMRITLTMPVDDAIARIPVLAQALRADDATTAPSESVEEK
ncbi:hypothetical protein ACFQ68_08620 [Amycolatopsis japonica]|uniref:hypothetical protein n=1 Tax=Amycolatopsis japonica TaxID=208439 RepID=UPI00366BA57D